VIGVVPTKATADFRNIRRELPDGIMAGLPGCVVFGLDVLLSYPSLGGIDRCRGIASALFVKCYFANEFGRYPWTGAFLASSVRNSQARRDAAIHDSAVSGRADAESKMVIRHAGH
jgi:hypothetical protein